MTILSDFLNYKHQDLSDPISLDLHREEGLVIHSHLFCSQIWPISKVEEITATQWCHRVRLFIPDNIMSKKALLHVSGGDSHDKDDLEVYSESKDKLDFTSIALRSQSIVVELQHVPNQYLMTAEGPKREDQFLAYTYKLFLQTGDPYIIGRLPMIKSITKTMDFIQGLRGIFVDSFVLSGMSKRGWAVWLAALEDERVSAIIPVVIDVLNTQKNLQHICSIYSGGCPRAFQDYINNGISNDVLYSEKFAELMKIEDPLLYLNYGKKYQQRFEDLQKYIINSSGDDFFAPDSSKFYFQEMSGNNHLRYLPNALHYMAGNPISDALDNLSKINDAITVYFSSIVYNVNLPKIDYQFIDNSIFVNSSAIPDKAILWVAYNSESRDFRFLSSYDYWTHLLPKTIKSYFSSNLCDRCYDSYDVIVKCEDEPCAIIAEIPEYLDGYRASFLELHYFSGESDNFIITTEINVTGAFLDN